MLSAAQLPAAPRALLSVPRLRLAFSAAAEAAAAMRGATATASRARLTQPEPDSIGGFGQGAVDQAIHRQGFGNSSSGVSDTGPLEFDVKDFDWGSYARRIYEIVDRNWKSVIPLAARTPGVQGKCKVRFRIARNGKVTAIELIASSSRGSLDQAAVASIELSNPLPPLPPEFPESDVGVTFAYYYNMPIEQGR